MFAKQALIDLGIVLIIPAFIVGGYYSWGGSTEMLLMTEQPIGTLGPDEPGEKTKLVLDTLNGIVLTDALFKDEAFTTLSSFSVPIPEVPLSRPNPFTPPPVIEERIRQGRLGNQTSRAILSAPSTQTLSSKIDDLKKTLGGN